MTNLYFVGGEDIDFTTIGGPTIETTSFYRTAFARCSLHIASNAQFFLAHNAMNGGTGLSSWWFTARVSAQSNAGGPLVAFNDTSDRNRLYLNVNSSSNLLLFKKTIAGVATQLATGTVALNTTLPAAPQKLDIQVSSYGAAGTVNVYIDGVLALTFTGDITTDAATVLNGFVLGASLSRAYWSEVIVADTDTRSMSLATLAPVANGNADTFDVGGVSNVSEVVNDDATVNASGTNGQIQQYTVEALPSGTFGVVAVAVSARAECGLTGPVHLELGVRTGSSDFWSSNFNLTTAMAGYQNIWTTNPDTTANWTTADLANAGFNIGLKSVT